MGRSLPTGFFFVFDAAVRTPRRNAVLTVPRAGDDRGRAPPRGRDHRDAGDAGRNGRVRRRPPLAEILRRFHADSQPAAAARVAADPVEVAREQPRPADREIAGLVAACLAYGNAQVARRNARDVVRRCGPAGPAAFARAFQPGARDPGPFAGFRHRFTGPLDVAALLAGAGDLLARHGSLGAAFGDAWRAAGARLLPALAAFRDALLDAPRVRRLLAGRPPSRALQYLLPDPRRGSTCKRLFLYLRWMVRPDDGVDLGLWPDIPAAALLVPVDTHVARIAHNLGLTRRRTPNLPMAEEITAALRAVDARDPVKLDFALCHLGISRACPSRRDVHKCAACGIRAVCIQWHPARP